MKLQMKHLALAASALVMSHSGFAAIQASLPEFKSKEELTKAQQSQATAVAGGMRDSFYTGKLYEADREGYLFKYRSYDPELTRWTSCDPSGFPDGANNMLYGNAPTSGVDPTGLAWHFVGENSNGSISDGTTYSVPVDLNGTIVGSYSITGFANGTATSLTMTLNVSNTCVGWFQTAAASLAPQITFNINPTSGEVTMSGTIQNDSTDWRTTVGSVNAAYNLGIQDGKNVTQGKIAFGYTYDSWDSTVSIGYTGSGLSVGVTIPTGMDWSQHPTLAFNLNKAE